MSTVFKRTFAFCKNNNIELFPIEDRKKIGKLALKKLFLSEKRFLKKVEQIEPEGIFQVWYFLKEFTPELDNIIKSYYKSIIKKAKKAA